MRACPCLYSEPRPVGSPADRSADAPGSPIRERATPVQTFLIFWGSHAMPGSTKWSLRVSICPGIAAEELDLGPTRSFNDQNTFTILATALEAHKRFHRKAV